MFDPQTLLKQAISKLHEGDKVAMIRSMVEAIADFIDRHDIIVPDLSVNAGPVVVSLSAKRLAPVADVIGTGVAGASGISGLSIVPTEIFSGLSIVPTGHQDQIHGTGTGPSGVKVKAT